jgi:uncharacterized protein YbaR (Trm112 family)
MTTDELRPWEYPDCPECDGHVFVESAGHQHHEWVCRRCKEAFDA